MEITSSSPTLLDLAVEEANTERMLAAGIVTVSESNIGKNWVDEKILVVVAILVNPNKSWTHKPLTHIPVSARVVVSYRASIWVSNA